ARKLVLATGVSDIAPTMPHLVDALELGALRYCPVCDGYEVRHQFVGLLADHGSDAFEALYLRHFTERITVFLVCDDVRFTDVQRRQLAEARIAIVPQPVRSIRLRANGGVTVHHGDT